MRPGKRTDAPPAVARRWLAWRLARHDALDVLHELDELFRHRASARGARAARRWYWRQLPSLFLTRFGTKRRSGSLILASARQDIVHALRHFRRTPAFTALTVGTLAIGIGAATALGSIVYPVLWHPLGYPDEDRIVRVWPERHFTQEDFDRFRERARSFSAFSGLVVDAFTLTGEGEPDVIRGSVVTAAHFDTYGVAPIRGRGFEPYDSLPGSEPVAVLSYALWQSRFAGREDILGRSIELGGSHGARRTIVGVAPPGFRPLGTPNLVWIPATSSPGTEAYRDMANLRIIARLAPGVDRDAARAELAAIASRLEPPPPYLDQVSGYSVVPLRDALVGTVRPTLLVLLGAVGLVFLLCCANAASLLLARNRARAREIAVRRALGASGARLARQWLTENVLLVAASGLLAVVAIRLLHATLTGFVPDNVPRAVELEPGLGLELGITGVILSLAAILLVGTLPLLKASGAGMGTRGGTAERSRTRWNAALVSGEVALSLALVVACGLLVKSFIKLTKVETGFAAPHVVTVRVSPSTLRYGDEIARKTFFREVVEAVDRMPAVEAVGAIQILPLTPSFMAVGYSPSGAPVSTGESPPFASYRVVTPDYRRALGIPLLAGRDLDARDRAGGRAVGLINETLANALVPPGDAVGRVLRFEDGSEWFTIVGVVGDVPQQKLDRAPIPEVYLPLEQDAWPSSMYVVARTSGEVPHSRIAPTLREAIWSVDDDVPLSEIRPMPAVVSASLTTERLRTVVFLFFALLAFVLSAVGVYGIVAYTVSQRTREIGVRMAFGATGARVVAETLRQNASPLIYGLLAGTALAVAASRSLASLLYDVPATDPVVYLGSILLLSLVAAMAAWLPARKASRFDPLTCLRLED